MKYFFDNCISYRFANMLIALEVDVTSLRAVYDQAIKDVSLFSELKGSGLVYVSGDTSQTRKVQEARALKEAGVTALFLGPFWSKMQFWQQAVWLVSKWPRIAGFSEGVTKGTTAEIKQNGAALVFNL